MSDSVQLSNAVGGYPPGTTAYQEFIHQSRYARYSDANSRREFWNETVDRLVNYYEARVNKLSPKPLSTSEKKSLRTSVWDMSALPSMRALMTAGPALDRDHVAAFNCSYLPLDHPKAFAETLYILMCGTGVGFSAERQYVSKLPVIPELVRDPSKVIIVQDSKLGWAEGLDELINYLYAGIIPNWDTSLVREAGARLKTFGGRASGPAPLEKLFDFVVHKFLEASGGKLSSLDAHDIACMIGEVVVVGGVRRSAMISLSNLSDDRMRNAKHGQFWETTPWRSMANNSVAHTEKPEVGHFMREWQALYESQSGERGIFNREGTRAKCLSIGRDNSPEFGTNPCGEVILRPYQFCNLSEIVIRSTDTLNDLLEKVRRTTILGTIQSSFTDFGFLRDIWRQNTEEECLLGVSLTGIMDHPILSQPSDVCATWLKAMRQEAWVTNREWAERLGINSSAAITTVKPSGTVSQLADTASGIHNRHSPFYIRRVRADKKDPLTQFLIDQGVSCEDDVMRPENTAVFSYPVRGPADGRYRTGGAIEHMKLVDHYNRHWADHNVSCTISVQEHEWPAVGAWVWENFDSVCGMSFLPYAGGVYKQAPYEEIDEAAFLELDAKTPRHIDWSLLAEYEGHEDRVKSTKDLACSAGVCEIVDIG